MVEYIMIAAGMMIARYVYKKNEAKIKGNKGERKLCRKLKRLKVPGKIKVIRDGLFRSEWGTSQIDALAITRYGIVVCEMKNYHGTIYGAVGQNDWTVMMGKACNDLYSPIKQNNSHVSALTHLLKDQFPQMRYLPIVVFGDEATLRIQNSRNKVCNLRDLQKVISRQLGPEVLSDQEVDEVTSFLENNQIKSRKARRNHVTGVQLKAEAKNKYTDMDIALIRNEIMESAKNKPIIRSNSFSIQNQPDSIGSNPPRLIEKIKEAEGKVDASINQNSYVGRDHMIH